MKLCLIFLTLLGLSLRFNVAHERAAKPFKFRGDEGSYVAPAEALLEGEFFNDPSRAPGYPLFVAAAFVILGDNSMTGLLYLQAVLGAAIVPLTYLLAREFVRRRRLALVAAALAAVDFGLLRQVPLAYSEILYTPMLLGAVLFWVRAARQPTLARCVAAGLFMGAVTVIRPLTVMFPLFVIFGWPVQWEWSRKLKATAVYAAAMAFVILPFTVNNLRLHGRFLPVSLSTAVLWQGSPEFYQRVNAGARLTDIWKQDLNPDVNGGHDPFTFEGESYFNRRAFAAIACQPMVYQWYCMQKAWYFWFGNYFSDVSYLRVFELAAQERTVGTIGSLNQMVTRQLPWVALAAGVVLATRGRQWWIPFLPVVVLVVYMTVVYALTYAGLRYSVPLHPLLIVALVSAYAALMGQAPAYAYQTTPAPSSPEPPVRESPPVAADPGFGPIVNAMVRKRQS